MASVTGLSATRMLQIEAASIIAGGVDLNGNLLLTKQDGSSVNAGNVRGPQGDPGTPADETALRTYTDDAEVAAKVYSDAATLRHRQGALGQRVLTGGGIRKVSSGGIAWSQRFIVMGAGRSIAFPSGYFDISIPPDGTVVPVYGSTVGDSVTVASGYLPLAAWRAVYYDLPFGSTLTSNPANFKVVSYTTTMIDIPPTWILIATRNGDSKTPPVMWGDGRSQDYWRLLTLGNSWVSYGSNWPSPAWRFMSDGQIKIRGLMRNGTTGTAVTTFTSDLAPEGAATTGAIFNQYSGSGFARVDMQNGGNLVVSSYGTGGSNTFVSLEGISWFPNGM